MKLNTVENKIERSGDLNDEANFTIALTAKAIEVLSSQIYKDAHLAIVRELGTNAADSHIEAGKRDVPFEVTLPNTMVPELVIRDFGTGMAYEKVMTMYRTYFGSDKTNSNEVTGCLGLGSKSPLAYTDQFNVTSWFEGEKSVYIVYKNERGLPAINRIHHEKSDEPTGVEVRISVKRHDFNVFRQKAIETYRWFTPRPKVGGVHDSEWGEEELAFGGEFWKLRKNTNQKMTVVMGNVAYHVEKGDLQPIRSKLGRAALTLADCGPILHVGIGDVDIAASRETLKFDGPKTYPTITKLLEKMAKEVVEKFQDQINKSPSHWEARKLFKKLKETQPLGYVLPEKVQWKGLDVETTIRLTKIEHHRIAKHFANARKYFMNRQRRTYQWCVSQNQADTIQCEENAQLFVIDGKNHISRVSHFVRKSLDSVKGTSAVAYVLTEAPKYEPVVKQDGTKEDPIEVWSLDKFIKENHLTGVVRKTSELPDPPRNAVGFRSKSSQVLTPALDHTKSSDWAENEVDFDAGGVYVEVKGNHWSAGNLVERKADDLFRLEPVIKANKIVGVRHRALAEFEEADNWVLLDKYIVDKYKNNEEARKAATRADVWQKICRSYEFNLLTHLLAFKNKPKDGLFATLTNALIQLEKDSKHQLAKEYNIALPFLGKALDSKEEYNEIRKLYKSFEQRYPMLTMIRDWHDTKAQATILHYIGLVDGIKLHRKRGKNRKKKSILPELQEV